MKRFLISFAIIVLVMIVSASNAQAERGRRGGHSYVTYSYVPATYVVPTYVAPVSVAPTYLVPTNIAPVVTTYTVHRAGRRGR